MSLTSMANMIDVVESDWFRKLPTLAVLILTVVLNLGILAITCDGVVTGIQIKAREDDRCI